MYEVRPEIKEAMENLKGDDLCKFFFDKFATAYIEVYGRDVWESLTSEQQMAAFRFLAKDFSNAITLYHEALEKIA